MNQPAAAKQAAAKKPAAKKATAAKKTTAKQTAPKKAAAPRKATPREAAPRAAVAPEGAVDRAALVEAVAKHLSMGQPAAEAANAALPQADAVPPEVEAAAAAVTAALSAAADAEAAQNPRADYVLIDPLWLERAYRLGVGSAMLAAASGSRVLGGNLGSGMPAEDVLDLGVGISDSVFEAVQRTVDRASRIIAPVIGAVRPPMRRLLGMVGGALAPAMVPVAERGRSRRAEAEVELVTLIESLIPDITDLILERIDLQAVLSRIDLQELVEASLEHIDMQAVMSKLDMTEAAEEMMGQLDLTQIALDHVDMNRIMENAVKQVDMVALVRAQLEGMDLTELLFTTPTSLATGALRQTTRLVRRG